MTPSAPTLVDFLTRSAERQPDRLALVHEGQRITYRELDEQSNQVANLLCRNGVHPGDRVALMLPNVPAFTIAYYGILKAGAAVVPLNILLKDTEVAFHLADAEATTVLAFASTPALPIADACRAACAQIAASPALLVVPADAPPPWAAEPTTWTAPAISAEDTAVVLYTSGTTGSPKGAELRHRNMRDNMLISEELFAVSADRPDVYLAVLPLFHSFGQTVIQNSAIAFGGTLVMLPKFEPTAALNLMRDEKVTFFAGVPTMYWAMLAAAEHRADIAACVEHLRVAAAGGSALPSEVHRQFLERFGVVIREGYGLSETSPVASFAPWGEPVRAGSIGRPVPGVQMRLIDADWHTITPGPEVVGEIAIRGHNVMKGYLNQPEATADAISDGWFRTGDLARMDEDGYFHIVDRSKDIIIRGGFNVYPREVEDILMTHPAVSLAAVIGMPHERHGEEVKAVIVPTADPPISADELREWAASRMAAYKYPRIVEFVEALPMTATGKILKRRLA